MNSPEEKQLPRVLNELPREPWHRRALNILCGIVAFLFFAGGVRDISQIIGHFLPWLDGFTSTIAICIALGSLYWLIHDGLERFKETKSQLALYRWETQQLKDAAGTAIRTDSTAPLAGALKDISTIEGETQ